MVFYVVQRCANHKKKSWFSSLNSFSTYEEAYDFFKYKIERFKSYPAYVKGDVIETVLLNEKQILELKKIY